MPNFNNSDELFYWSPSGSVTWSSDDSDGCPNSGSVMIGSSGSISQCITVTPGVRYYFGVRHKVSDSATQPYCSYDFRTYACADTTYYTARFAGASTLSWSSPPTAATVVSDVAPSDAQTLRITCQTQGSQVLIDQIFVNAGTFTGF
jgi:hypothetical protein